MSVRLALLALTGVIVIAAAFGVGYLVGLYKRTESEVMPSSTPRIPRHRMFVITMQEISPAQQRQIGALLGHPGVPATQDECRAFLQRQGDQCLANLRAPTQGAFSTFCNAMRSAGFRRVRSTES